MVARSSLKLERKTLGFETEEEHVRREANETVGIVCVLEIPRKDLDNVKGKFKEFEEARRNIEASLCHLNYKTKLLDADWHGWRVKSFTVDPATPQTVDW